MITRETTGSEPALTSILNDSGLLLNERDLAARWRISVRTLQNKRVQGCGIPFLKLGRSVRYRMSDVLAHEDAMRRSSTNDGGCCCA